MFQRVNPDSAEHQFGSVATNGSARGPAVRAAFAGEVVGAVIINASTAVASGTTTGSAASFVVYKNASNTASRIATFNGSGTAIAADASQEMTITSNANARFASGDKIICEMVGGVANNADNTGLKIQVDYVYGRETGATPSAATGPA